VREVRSQLETERADREEMETELSKEKYNYSTLVIISQQFNQQLSDREAELAELRSENSELQQKLAIARELSTEPLPDAATILSHLRGKRKKSTVTLADIDAILGIIEKS